MRPSGRQPNELRAVSIETGISKYAEGSCLVKFGDTHVFCTASVEARVPPWMRNLGRGWITAEYGMLPRATSERTGREAARGRQSGRTQEIQRLIGRSFRSIANLEELGERQVRIDCDVLQADGGTRTAAITGGYVALRMAVDALMKTGALKANPVSRQVAAVSCGIFQGVPILDLDYAEDSVAETDANFVMTDDNLLIEVQGTAETEPFPRAQFTALLDLAEAGIADIARLQREALGD